MKNRSAETKKIRITKTLGVLNRLANTTVPPYVKLDEAEPPLSTRSDPRPPHGQALAPQSRPVLRGSSDLHAWTDSACYLVRRPDDRLQLTVEHRSAPAPDPLLLRLSGGADQPLSLLVDSADAPPPPLAEAVRAALRSAGQPLSRTVLRQRLRVNNARLGVALQTLQQRGLAVRSPNGWHLPS